MILFVPLKCQKGDDFYALVSAQNFPSARGIFSWGERKMRLCNHGDRICPLTRWVCNWSREGELCTRKNSFFHSPMPG